MLKGLQRWIDAELWAEQLICLATGLTVAESWAAERVGLTALPEILPEPFDDVGVRRVGIDGLVAFKGATTACRPPISASGSRFVAAPAPSKS